MEEVPEEVLKKLARYYNLYKHGTPSDSVPPWIRNINNMSKTDLEYETRDAIRTCRDLRRKLNELEYEGEKLIPVKSKREKIIEELRREWSYMSYYLYTLFLHSGVKVSEEEFDEFLRNETGSRSYITNLSSQRA
ncbi:hypothetical protein [Candidatus Solincola tengchongensis]|uniref:hypothetical protein n=1 Tax=Candidatus Solincola tengchongensis TaxID=2900693 RepID=UPI00257EF5E1|nr:hypothetical protein [Candidatus Solincola tengchongensis]